MVKFSIYLNRHVFVMLKKTHTQKNQQNLLYIKKAVVSFKTGITHHPIKKKKTFSSLKTQKDVFFWLLTLILLMKISTRREHCKLLYLLPVRGEGGGGWAFCFWCRSNWCWHDTFLTAQNLVNQWLDSYQNFIGI